VNLKVTDIDLELGIVFIRGGKKTKQRTLGLKPSQVNFLIRYIENDRPNLISQSTKPCLLPFESRRCRWIPYTHLLVECKERLTKKCLLRTLERV
jgi:site-specific recombinase XerD